MQPSRLFAPLLIAGLILAGTSRDANAVPEGQACGGRTGTEVCDDGLFCELPAGSCRGIGICSRRPAMCTKEYRPVCGCDGKTYGNDCTRRAGGASKLANGKC